MDEHTLLQHSDWVRALARSLVHDVHHADDVEQRAWLEVCQRPPRNSANLRGWFRRVLQNAVRQERRAAGRRATRERRSAVSEQAAATIELVERADLGRHLAGMVLELDEPVRRTLLLRYSEGLEPTEIAHLEGESAGTVRSRIKRGLDRVRARLDEEAEGDRRAWLAVLAPWAAAVPIRTTAGLGAVVIALAIGGTLFVAGSAWFGSTDSFAKDGGGGPDQVSTASVATTPDQDDQFADRVVSPVASRVSGEVVDRWGDVVSGARVHLFADRGVRALDLDSAVASGVTDQNGRFFVDLPAEVTSVAVQVDGGESGVAFLRRRPVGESGVDVGRLDLVPKFWVRGQVCDEAGEPVPGSWVKAHFDTGVGLIDWRADCDEHGNFRLECNSPGSHGVELVAIADGYAPTRADEAGCSTAEQRLVLRRGASLRGVVLDYDDRPIAGARIAQDFALHRITGSGWVFPDDSPRQTRSREDGSFTLADCPIGMRAFRVAADGYFVSSFSADASEGEAVEVKLQAQAVPGRVSGVIVDARTGDPVAGVAVAEQVVTGADGAFEVRKIRNPWLDRPVAEYTLNTSLAGYADARLSLPWGADHHGVRIELQPAVVVHLLVLDPDGRPIPYVNVQFAPQSDAEALAGRSPPPYAHAKTGIDGAVTKEIGAGPYRTVTIYHSGYPVERYVYDFDPEPGSVHDWTFGLGEGRSVTGRVLDDATGEAIENARVSAWQQQEERARCSASTDSGWDGSYCLEGFEPRRLWVKVLAPGYAPQVHPLTLPEDAGEVGTFDVRLKPGFEVKGRVLDPAGSPAAGCWVNLVAHLPAPLPRIYGTFNAWNTDEEGRFSITDLPEIMFDATVRPRDQLAEQYEGPPVDVILPPHDRDWRLRWRDGAEQSAPDGGAGVRPPVRGGR